MSHIENVTIEDDDGRIKVVMPTLHQPIYLALYSGLMLVWLGATVWMLVMLFGVTLEGLTLLFRVVWIIILVVWSYVWYRLGRFVWKWWLYFAAKREIVFVDDAVMIVRRPVSLFGVTDGYDMEHVGPFFYSEREEAIAFPYGSRGSHFAKGVAKEGALRLINLLNRRFFPHAEAEAP